MQPTKQDLMVLNQVKKVFLECDYQVLSSRQEGNFLVFSVNKKKIKGFREEVIVKYHLPRKYLQVFRKLKEKVADEKIKDLLSILNFTNHHVMLGHFYLCLESHYVTCRHGMFVVGDKLEEAGFKKSLMEISAMTNEIFLYLRKFLLGSVKKNGCFNDIFRLGLDDVVFKPPKEGILASSPKKSLENHVP